MSLSLQSVSTVIPEPVMYCYNMETRQLDRVYYTLVRPNQYLPYPRDAGYYQIGQAFFFFPIIRHDI